MDAIAQLQQLANDKVEVFISQYDFQEKWTVKLLKDTEAIKLEVIEKGTDLIETIERACAKYQRVIGKGISEFAGPLLEHKPTRDDDILF